MSISSSIQQPFNLERLLIEAQVFVHSRDAIAICDMNLKVMAVNKAFSEITGFESSDVIGDNFQSLVAPEGLNWPDLELILKEESFLQGERDCPSKDGSTFPAVLSLYRINLVLRHSYYYLAFISDLREERARKCEMVELMYRDTLTHLPNQLLLKDRLRQALLKAERYHRCVGLVFVDIDHFSIMNDSLGHEVGDYLLKAFAERLQANMRASDTVCRYSADQFLILSTDMVSSKDIQAVLTKIHSIVSTAFELPDGRALMLTVTTGAAVYPEHGGTEEGLLQHAENALVEAKHKGGGQSAIYNPDRHKLMIASRQIETDLRHALANKEFLLYYQPQFEMETGRLISLEALIRWQHPEHGLMLPGTFINIAERSGLILPMSDWVLEHTCRQLCLWQEMKLDPVPVAINICASQFRQDLVHILAKMLKRYRLDPSFIQLELTESMIMDDAEYVVDALQQLKKMGIKLAIDDFGTGYSSLSYLSRFALDKLKVDRSFVQTILGSEDSLPIPQAIISLAHTLKLKVTAEGVETPEQVAFLRQHECDEAQGFLLSPPIPGPEIHLWLSEKDRLSSQYGLGSSIQKKENN
ncbi:MAG: EAL domain-containing protein [Pseudomonadota bacterium]